MRRDHRPAKRRLVFGAVVLLLTAHLFACGEDDGAEGEPTPPTGELPPPDALDLEPLYGDALAEVGMRLTDRGGLIDTTDGGYEASPTGRHLALYVEPIESDRSMREFYDGILDVALIFSDIYDRWPQLETYDVCQEPPDPDGTQGAEPLPVTQLVLDRAQSDAIDWDRVTVEDLIRGSRADPPTLTLRVSTEMIAFPAYVAAAHSDAAAANDPYSAG